MTTKKSSRSRIAAATIVAGAIAGAAGIATAAPSTFSFTSLGSAAELRGSLTRSVSGDSVAAKATPTPDHKEAEGKCGEGKCG